MTLEEERKKKLSELKELETKIMQESIKDYTRKLSEIKEFILTNGPCIDLTKVNSNDRILYDENYSFDDVYDPMYVDYINLTIREDDEDSWWWTEERIEINSGCYFDVDYKYLTEKSYDYGRSYEELRGKIEYKDHNSILDIETFRTLEENKAENKEAMELIDEVYRFIKKYPEAFYKDGDSD